MASLCIKLNFCFFSPLEYGYTDEDEFPEFDLESTEVRELQILRDHTDYLTCIKVFGNTIYSSCSDGEVSTLTCLIQGVVPINRVDG